MGVKVSFFINMGPHESKISCESTRQVTHNKCMHTPTCEISKFRFLQNFYCYAAGVRRRK